MVNLRLCGEAEIVRYRPRKTGSHSKTGRFMKGKKKKENRKRKSIDSRTNSRIHRNPNKPLREEDVFTDG